MESTENSQGVSTESIENSPWSPLYFRKSLWTPCRVLMESTWSPHGVHVDCMKYSHKIHGLLMDSTLNAHGVLMESM